MVVFLNNNNSIILSVQLRAIMRIAVDYLLCSSRLSVISVFGKICPTLNNAACKLVSETERPI